MKYVFFLGGGLLPYGRFMANFSAGCFCLLYLSSRSCVLCLWCRWAFAGAFALLLLCPSSFCSPYVFLTVYSSVCIFRDCLCCHDALDLAVGAPYEGAGAVYVYYGSADGLPATYSQRIYARDLVTNAVLSAFGASLAGGADLDGNGYPDLIIGAYQSSAMAVLLSRPVVNIDASISAMPQRIDTSARTCSFDQTTNLCFQVKVCFRFRAEPIAKWDNRSFLMYSVLANWCFQSIISVNECV